MATFHLRSNSDQKLDNVTCVVCFCFVYIWKTTSPEKWKKRRNGICELHMTARRVLCSADIQLSFTYTHFTELLFACVCFVVPPQAHPLYLAAVEMHHSNAIILF